MARQNVLWFANGSAKLRAKDDLRVSAGQRAYIARFTVRWACKPVEESLRSRNGANLYVDAVASSTGTVEAVEPTEHVAVTVRRREIKRIETQVYALTRPVVSTLDSSMLIWFQARSVLMWSW